MVKRQKRPDTGREVRCGSPAGSELAPLSAPNLAGALLCAAGIRHSERQRRLGLSLVNGGDGIDTAPIASGKAKKYNIYIFTFSIGIQIS